MSIPKSFKTRHEPKNSDCASIKLDPSPVAMDGHKRNIDTCGNEAEYLFDKISDAIRVINSDFTIRRINRSFADMTGVKQNEIIGKKCWEIFPSHHCGTEKCRLQRILNGEKKIKEEIERKKKDGSTMPCIVTVFPLMDKEKRLSAIIERFYDITERRHMENRVKETENLYRL
jgi:PAS domain S-box-containing protein